ncbi:Transmembrane channel-like protein 7 [Lamellibrachia satsuma]|nr:Transmembrane channel-like protein 7 [Lamellibrachia satsuma]
MRESVCFSLEEMASARWGLIANSIFNRNADDEEKSSAKQDGEERWTDLPDITDSIKTSSWTFFGAFQRIMDNSTKVDITKRAKTKAELKLQLDYVTKMYPRQVDMHALRDESNPIAQLELVRNMAIPLSAKHVLRDYWNLNDIKAGKSIVGQHKRFMKTVKEQLMEARGRLEIWSSSLKTIEGRFGSGVASYFQFLRWLFVVNSITFLVPLLFLFVPVLTSQPRPYDAAVARNISQKRIMTVERCSREYVNYTKTEFRLSKFNELLTDVLQGTGWLERTPLFYGYYENKRVGNNERKLYNLPMAYLMVTIIYLFCTFLFMIQRSTSTATTSNNAATGKKGIAYAQVVFVTWNYTMNEVAGAALQHRTIYADIIVRLEEAREERRRRKRTQCQVMCLYLTRVFVNLLIFSILIGVVALIFFVTNVASKSLSLKSSDSTFVNLIFEYIPSITITLVNFIVPRIFSNLIPWEQYSADTQLAVILARTITLRMSSIVILLIAIFHIVTCKPVNECNVGLEPQCQSFQCWETYVGQQIFKLLIMDFIASLLGVFVFDYARTMLVKSKNRYTRWIGKGSFNIPKNVLHLVYCQTLCWLCFFFVPLVPAIAVVKCVFLFYLRKFACLRFYEPANHPFQASSAAYLFVWVLMASFGLCIAPILFVLLKLTPSRGCGPFRLYEYMYSIILVWAETLPSWPRFIVKTMAAPVFIVPLYLVTIMLLYYYKGRATSNYRLAMEYKYQMKIGEADREFLQRRLNSTV